MSITTLERDLTNYLKPPLRLGTHLRVLVFLLVYGEAHPHVAHPLHQEFNNSNVDVHSKHHLHNIQRRCLSIKYAIPTRKSRIKSCEILWKRTYIDVKIDKHYLHRLKAFLWLLWDPCCPRHARPRPRPHPQQQVGQAAVLLLLDVRDVAHDDVDQGVLHQREEHEHRAAGHEHINGLHSGITMYCYSDVIILNGFSWLIRNVRIHIKQGAIMSHPDSKMKLSEYRAELIVCRPAWEWCPAVIKCP